MDKKKVIEKLKERVKRYRAKHVGDKQGKNVSKPRSHHKQADASKEQAKHKQVRAVGPRGGQYVATSSGRKDYQKSLVKGKIKEWLMDQEENLKKEENMSDLNKAVSSEAAVQNEKKDEATMNGENKPTIQEATTPSKEAEKQAAPTEVKAETPATPAPAAEVKKEETKPTQKMKEFNFEGLFSPDFSLGSTLKQDPRGGNVMANMKKPAMDYVESAKNKKNVTMTEDDFKNKK